MGLFSVSQQSTKGGIMNNRDLCRVYAQGTVTNASGSNMFIEDDTIYSYGHHYKIAVRLNPAQKFATNISHVYNDTSNSNTTAKHKAYVRGELTSYIAIPNCDIEEKPLRDYLIQLKLEVDEVEAKQSKLKTKKVRYQQFQDKIAVMTERVKEVEHFTVALYGGQAIQFIKEAV